MHVERTFSVVNTHDLNNYPALKIGQHAEGMKKLCCWPCESDPIIGTLSLEKG